MHAQKGLFLQAREKSGPRIEKQLFCQALEPIEPKRRAPTPQLAAGQLSICRLDKPVKLDI